ncbi:SnoaL-like domain protein (plasmid) [Caballeronia sp. SBC1]|jgi:ketosteroid isomerase-like protein|uniref:nuclear transport factor 2 family protein n=1 Tax=unclassified Caballeronia TaxID=2646786 RepID=UPI0013E0FD05|nr:MULTISPECIES: nuclear transport factor 2 family protein [unclassified Caballeronia]QIE28597.1 SnoaL-like domain protein [Caballeronia sp. SBC2]QIN66652.1 SnoaL-like domain protein [Caballeronia sp. SBC1]
MTDPNAALIQRFYEAFQRSDAEAMAACYAPDVQFSDPVFGVLRGREASDMWRMLLSRATEFSLTFGDIQTVGQTATAHWVATYRFTQTGRKVVNRINARFAIRDGLIFEHHDSFDLWTWSRQALGLKGLLLGWSSFVQKKIRAQASNGLRAYRQQPKK